MRFKLLITILLSTIIVSCTKGGDHTTAGKSHTITVDGKENFNAFLKKFVADSTFRQTRVTFPLRGHNSEDERNKNNNDTIYLWNKFDWQWYSEEDFGKAQPNNDVKSTKLIKTDSSMIYRIYKKDSGYDMRYDFQEKEGKWYLIYYQYQNL